MRTKVEKVAPVRVTEQFSVLDIVKYCESRFVKLGKGVSKILVDRQ